MERGKIREKQNENLEKKVRDRLKGYSDTKYIMKRLKNNIM